MKFLLKTLKILLSIIAFSAIFSVIVITAFFFIINPELPSIEDATTYQLDTPLKVYTKDEKLIAVFGESKREPLLYREIPPMMIKAIIAAEDSRFYSHPGVDFIGLTRAVVNLIVTGKKGQGGSTITMQVARNFFLSRKKTYIRKIKEIFLAIKLEMHFSKEKILELYLNKIYLGHRSYGIATAAKTYYGKPIHQLQLHHFAMLAGLPKAPSKYNPVTNIKRATLRRNYILRRMMELDFISLKQYQRAINTPDDAKIHVPIIELNAPYVAEMARTWMLQQKPFKDDAYTGGYKVYTSIDSHLQAVATRALRDNLMRYEHRHGYKGAVKNIKLQLEQITISTDRPPNIASSYQQQLLQQLNRLPQYGHLKAALVLSIRENKNLSAKKIQPGYAWVLLRNGQVVKLPWKGIQWAKKYISDTRFGKAPKQIKDVLKTGDLIYLAPLINEAMAGARQSDTQEYQLAQVPEVSGALVSLKPQNGRIVALSGGFDFYLSKFNRITQAKRQAGSNFKPFIYSAALKKGYTVATVINDAPVVFNDKNLEGAWRPSNYSGKFFGPTRFRKALYKSRNMVSIRILMDIGIDYALDYVRHFGFDPQTLPHNLSLSLGSANLTPLQIVTGYAVFANGGYQVHPWLIDKVVDRNGKTVYQHQPVVACSSYYPTQNCPEDEKYKIQRSVDEDNVFLMTSVLKDVIKRGTGVKAKILKRSDIAGKTGTTNDQVDAWFSGYNRDFVTTAWVGFDTPRSLGRYETGGRAALPMWIDFMREALKQSEPQELPLPDSIIRVKIDEKTGLLASPGSKHALFEYFIKGTEPRERARDKTDEAMEGQLEAIEEELF